MYQYQIIHSELPERPTIDQVVLHALVSVALDENARSEDRVMAASTLHAGYGREDRGKSLDVIRVEYTQEEGE